MKSFANSGGDAVMVVPERLGDVDVSAYVHLAAFMRDGPAGQKDALWREVGRVMGERVGEKAIWLSTAGMGGGVVAWAGGWAAEALWVAGVCGCQ